MTPNGPVSGIQILKQVHHQFQNFEVIEAGESGWDDGYCFGSDDGRIRFTSSGREFHVESREPINGIAFTQEMMAVSTCCDVTFWKKPAPGAENPERVVYRGGAHGVISTPSGKFIAPLGPNGLLEMSGNAGGSDRPQRYGIKGRDFLFYKAASVGTYEGRDVVVCALRQGGWARYFLGGPPGFDIASDSDIVDVCRLQSDRFPRATVALAFDNSLRIIEDAATSSQVMTLRLGDLRGRAFQILSSERQTFLLTSESLYSLGDLVHRCLDGERFDKPKVRKSDVEAVCASIAHDRSLLIVRPDGVVTEMNINDLSPAGGRVRPDGGVTEFALNDLTLASGAGDSFTITPSMTFDDSPLTRYEIVLV